MTDTDAMPAAVPPGEPGAPGAPWWLGEVAGGVLGRVAEPSRKVADTMVRRLRVSTVRLPDLVLVDVTGNRRAAPRWETMIFDHGAPGEWRWHSPVVDDPLAAAAWQELGMPPRFEAHPLDLATFKWASVTDAARGHRAVVRLARRASRALGGPPPLAARQRARGGRRRAAVR